MSRSTAAKVTPRNLASSARWIKNWHLALAAFEAEPIEDAGKGQGGRQCSPP